MFFNKCYVKSFQSTLYEGFRLFLPHHQPPQAWAFGQPPLSPQGETHQKHDYGQPDRQHGKDFPALADFIAVEKNLEPCTMVVSVVAHGDGRLRETSPYSHDPQPDAALLTR